MPSNTKLDMTSKEQAAVNVREIVYPLHERFLTQQLDVALILTAHVTDNVPDDLCLNRNDITVCIKILLANALKHTQQGRVHIHVDMAGLDTLNLIVADTGCGLNSKAQTAINQGYERVRQAKLSPSEDSNTNDLEQVYKILNTYNGELSINSYPERGSEFSIKLHVQRGTQPNTDSTDEIIKLQELWRTSPELATDEQATNTTASTQSIPHNPRGVFSRRKSRRKPYSNSTIEFSNMHVLVVEDVRANQEVLRSILEPVGCRVTTADNGQEAVDQIDVQSFDVVLMDIRMPIMNGVQATQTIRNTRGPNQDVPIIALTADASQETNAQCLAAGADVFLTKPIVISELFSAIRFACSLRDRRDRSTAKNQQAIA